jgi:hypothetical protein
MPSGPGKLIVIFSAIVQKLIKYHFYGDK